MLCLHEDMFNFVGRILGPDGSTAKCLQQCLGVKIMVRGRGSMRDRKKVNEEPDYTGCNNFSCWGQRAGRVFTPYRRTYILLNLRTCILALLPPRLNFSSPLVRQEEANIGKPNWEHLNDKLHVVLSVEDYENRAQARLDKASEYVSLFLKESLKAVL
ncbi:unnamed protein product [Echinostoma caproni]|uniref:KH_dom_type_1 domain-containing protein n=1 Tax=Echinostoma caproni TaxID=27848 RepID=A0A183AC83_9TREM|nr:unnamed protein product [Echinostoma caproni]